jgi:hypothetical protein
MFKISMLLSQGGRRYHVSAVERGVVRRRHGDHALPLSLRLRSEPPVNLISGTTDDEAA